MLAARMRKPLITDVIGIRGSGTDAVFTRPMFQGKLSAEVKPIRDVPHLVSFQIGAFRADAAQRRAAAAPVSSVETKRDVSAIRQQRQGPLPDADAAVDVSPSQR